MKSPIEQAVAMHVCALSLECHVPASTSLKAKRMAIRPVLDVARSRFHLAASEVAFQDQWQRARLGFAAVGSDPGVVTATLDALERYVWSRPDLEVTSTTRDWLELEA